MLSAADITRKCVCIVRFGPSGFPTDGITAGEYYQVTVDPDRFSASKEFIRFGDYKGDELTGWMRAAMITVVDVLGDWPEEGEPEMKWHTSSAIKE